MPRSYSAFIVLRHSKIEPKTLRYAAVPTLPLSGGNEKTVTHTFLSMFFFFCSPDHFSARFASDSMRSACGIERPVTPSRPAKMIGSIAPSSSGRATWGEGWGGERGVGEGGERTGRGGEGGVRHGAGAHLEGDLDGVEAELRVLPLLERLERGGHRAQVRAVELLQRRDRLGVVRDAGPPTRAKPVRLITASTRGLPPR